MSQVSKEASRRKASLILIVLQGNDADGDIVSLACAVAGERGAELRGLYVVEIPRSQPLASWNEKAEEEARAVLERARREAGRLGCRFEGRVLPSRDAGQAIVDESVEISADLVVISKPFRSKRGDAALHVLDRALCTVLVWRPRR